MDIHLQRLCKKAMSKYEDVIPQCGRRYPSFRRMMRGSTGKNFRYTQPVGLGSPAILQAPLPGPEGKSSYTSFSL